MRIFNIFPITPRDLTCIPVKISLFVRLTHALLLIGRDFGCWLLVVGYWLLGSRRLVRARAHVVCWR